MSLDYILDKMDVRQMCLYYDYMVEYYTGKPVGLGFDEPDLESIHQTYGPGQVIKR